MMCAHYVWYSRVCTAEIERVMKKVDEGVELFDEIWEKVYAAEQQNQKEKYEMDLKKEIKKLQRLRDQIKTWIGSSDVKDKDDLIEARKLIETKMEQFKVCEKETKTKTYSKEGLARAERLDPGEQAKLDTESWIRDYIDQLQQLVEDADVEIERLSAGKGKKTNKAQIDDLMHHIAQHKFHIHKLEGIIRLVINDVLDVDLVDPLKDDLDYYLDSNNDDDYQQAYDDEMFYESLALDELDVVDVDRVTQVDVKKDATIKSDDSSASTGQGGGKNKKDKRVAPASIPLKIGRATSKTKNAEEEKAVVVTPVKKVLAPAPARPPPPPPTSGGASMAAILKREQDQEKERQQKVALIQVCCVS
jgi:CCR4-NOT transcription complex subunit 3